LHDLKGRRIVTSPICTAPIPFAALVEYWFGDLGQGDEERIEEHLLGCAQCSDRLDDLAELGAGISSAFRSGAVWAVISPALLQKMKEEGLRLREYPVAPGGSVNCTISAADDAVISRLEASLEGVTRLDVVHLNDQGEVRLFDIPFEPTAREVLFCPSAVRLKKKSAHTHIVRLLAVDQAGERPLGHYTFFHTPS
jgi:hypothetical protein